MPTSLETINFFLDQTSNLQNIKVKKMFGDYGIYYKNKFCGLICDNRLFLKATTSIRKVIVQDNIKPYPGGGKNYWHIDDSIWDQPAKMCVLIRLANL